MARKKDGKKKEQDEFPQTIYVTIDPHGNTIDPPFELLAHDSEGAGIENDGPTRVAKYQYVREGIFSKRVVEE